jgi:membrane protein
VNKEFNIFKLVEKGASSIKSRVKDVKEFFSDDIGYYASSLSYYTLFSIIPLLLIILSILPNLLLFEGYYTKFLDFIFSNIAPTNQEVVVGYINSFLDNSLKMGMVGLVYVLFATMMFFRNFESIANKIFGLKPQGFVKSIPIYWTLTTLSPVGLVLSFYISGIIQRFLDKLFLTSWINLLEVLPFLIIWVIFYMTYRIIINKELLFKSTLISSFIASLVWYLAKTLFIYYAFYNKTYTDIYGSFSTIFFFMLWTYFSWFIFLHGLKLCHLIEQKVNRDESRSSKE